MSVYTKLNDARFKFHELKLTKTGHNKFANYKYFELGDFLIPALKVFREAGLCAFVTFEKELARMAIIDVECDDPMGSGKFILIESPMGSAALKGCHEVQNIGAVETYQRRYLWVAALEIVEHDALDATTGSLESTLKTSIAVEKAKKTGVMADVLEHVQLTAEDREYLDDLAQNVIDLFTSRDVSTAYVRLESEGLDNDQKIYVWSKLPSNLRTALKKAGAAMKETA